MVRAESLRSLHCLSTRPFCAGVFDVGEPYGDAVLVSMTNKAGTIVLGALISDEKFYIHLVLFGKEHRVVNEGIGVRLALQKDRDAVTGFTVDGQGDVAHFVE